MLHALDGGFVPAGPSGSPLRGLINVLPTGRNFYSVDPKAVPSRLAWETGQAMADSLLQRYLADQGEYPRSVGLSVWGSRCWACGRCGTRPAAASPPSR
ncbi:cobaltochelatase subunit CobN [Mycobacteroides abscessus subsp. abscessus]|nr:cobaltochelatase subunit CobN [Mycobacteroides abscessus subsp. abscessus]